MSVIRPRALRSDCGPDLRSARDALYQHLCLVALEELCPGLPSCVRGEQPVHELSDLVAAPRLGDIMALDCPLERAEDGRAAERTDDGFLGRLVERAINASGVRHTLRTLSARREQPGYGRMPSTSRRRAGTILGLSHRSILRPWERPDNGMYYR